VEACSGQEEACRRPSLVWARLEKW